MEIYILANRLFMITEVNETFSPERKQMMDLENPKVQEWEELMCNFNKRRRVPKKAKNGYQWRKYLG